MASAPTGRRAGERHQLTQAALVSLLAAAIHHIFVTLLDPHDLKGSTPKVTIAVRALVVHYGRASSAEAMRFYRNQRRVAGVSGQPPRLPIPKAQPEPDVRAAVERALSPLYGPVDAKTLDTAEKVLTSEVEGMVLDQSRTAIIDASQNDQAAKGWARVTEPGACSFCRLLATRGAVYKTEASADFRAHVMKPNGSGGTCRCHVEPSFTEYEMTAQARQDLADYRELQKIYGTSGRDLLVAWRQHIEGRPVTGPLTKPYTRS